MGRFAAILISGLVLLAQLADAATSLAPTAKLSPVVSNVIDFARDIQPIFAERCYSCHGAEKQKSGLRLDRKTNALAGGDSGKILQPHKSAESLLIKYVSGLDPEKIMPPKGERLTTNQVALLRAWIDGGAVWPDNVELGTRNPERLQHWSFQAPQRTPPPKVKAARWVRNPIDAFVLAKLESEDIKPSPEADRVTLIRRLSLDLLGLPPSPEQVQSFLKDKRPDAYERLVDALLSSPHFGERWGRHWLDLARYADSEGYQIDRARPFAYVYRNWVINAINRDLPFDQFTIEQLAGDLLPNATVEQKIAVGFHRNTLMNHESGVDREEFVCKAKVDRVSTTGTVWLGLTVGCAECHTHKYDPITQREFYQLYAFFNNVEEVDIPAVQPTELEKYTREKKSFDEETARLKTALEAYSKESLRTNQSKWEQGFSVPATRWTVLQPTNVASAEGTVLKTQSDHSVRAVGRIRSSDTYTIEVATKLKGITGFRLEVLPVSGKGAARNRPRNFVLSEFNVQEPGTVGQFRPILLQNASADFSPKEFPISGAIDGLATSGWSITPNAEQRHVAVFESRAGVDCSTGGKLVFTLAQKSGIQSTIGHFRISATTSPQPLRADLLPDSVIQIFETTPEKRTKKQIEELAKYYREEVDPVSKNLTQQLEKLSRRAPAYQEARAQIFTEGTNALKTFVHVRGDFMRHGDEVQPGTLAALHPFKPRSEKPDRLDLARWLVEPTNPLTSRVTVNHAWQHLFGRGLVATPGDFGMRGEPPSHLELLNWLAMEFRQRGWSRKALIKLIVTSATYRQVSHIREDLNERDPVNILLARQNRFRLESEIIRDVYLAAGGKLNAVVGGPSFRPPMPETFKALGGAGAFEWVDSEGSEIYRRGLYVFTQRTVPYPVSMTFDAASSSETCTRRERSTTPLQALTLMNNLVFVECAQGLGQRMQKEKSGRVRLKIEHGFELCFARKPSGEELARLEKLYDEELRLTRSHPEFAEKIIGTGEVDHSEVAETAALVAVGQILMNLDEFITRE